MTNYHTPQHNPNSGRVWVGLIIIVIGLGMLTKTLGFIFAFPDWIFSWPMWLIIIGLIIGARSNFKKNSSFICIFIGAYFLLERIIDADMDRFFWPVLIIVLGGWLIAGRNRNRLFRPFNGPDGDDRFRKDSPTYRPSPGVDLNWDKRVDDSNNANTNAEYVANEQNEPDERSSGFGHTANMEDYIDSVSVFGQIKKIIYSKDFKGGDIVNIMGGADINLMQADIQQPVVLDVVQIFGGTTVIVPAHWKVHPEMTAIFGGVEDKRFLTNVAVDQQKNLIIKGTSIFGGITIKSI